MKTKNINLVPRDLLFMRDARPMEASDAGLGANWPRPDQLWNAITAAFWRQWPERQPFEGEMHTKSKADKHQDNAFRFGGLLTAGPFPCKKDNGNVTCYFPCPLDLAIDEQCVLQPMTLQNAAGTNLPSPLKYSFCSPVLGKEEPPKWIDYNRYLQYLKGQSVQLETGEKEEQGKKSLKKVNLFDAERNIGVAIDPETGTAREHQLYQAEYLRLAKGVSMACLASCYIKAKGTAENVDILDKYLACSHEMVMGGQQGVVAISQEGSLKLPSIECPIQENQPTPVYIRWTLLSPAIFPEIRQDLDKGVQGNKGGWLPSWIDASTGQVLLRTATKDLQRQPGEDRKAWRLRCQGELLKGATLVAARIHKPIYFSGWKTARQDDNAPKQTYAAVPAGSVYLFRCETAKAAINLWKLLNAVDGNGTIVNRRSGVYGEKGFGLGVCSLFKGIVPEK